MAFIDDYKGVLSNAKRLQSFINERLDELYDYYSLSNYEVLVKDKAYFKSLPTYASISELDFSQTKNETFLNLLLTTAVRLNEPFGFRYFLSILERENLEKSKITEASTIFMNCTNATELIDGYSSLLNLLEDSFLTQSDGRKEPLAVLLNYYATAIINFAEFNNPRLREIRSLLVESYESKTKTFLEDSVLDDALKLSIAFDDNPNVELQKLIDNYLDRNVISPPFVLGNIIESDTAYADVINSKPFSANEIWELNRQLYNQLLGDKNSIFYSLGRGTAVLTTEDQLVVYMSQLGKMHFAKLNDAFNGLPNNLTNIHLFDWGCGQAPASKLFFDRFSNDTVKSLTLIEPSQAALKRGSLHLSNDTEFIRTVNKDFDSLLTDDIELKKDTNDITVHIFSNVIDMAFFQLHNLIELLKITSSGPTYYVVVSPFITITQTQRIQTFMEEICDGVNSQLLLSDDKKRYDWIKTWSKVIRVFSTES